MFAASHSTEFCHCPHLRQLTVFGGDVVHNGLDRLRHLGMNSTGLAALLSEPVNGYTIAAAILRDLQSPKLFAW
jgi:hypothetical protein